ALIIRISASGVGRTDWKYASSFPRAATKTISASASSATRRKPVRPSHLSRYGSSPVAPHSCFADGAPIQHEEAIATPSRHRLLRSARGDDPEAGRYVAEHRHAEPSVLMANEVRHALELAKDRGQEQQRVDDVEGMVADQEHAVLRAQEPTEALEVDDLVSVI